MYFSEELYNAEKYGYKFEVEYGYLFEKSKNVSIFKEYVNYLYSLKKKSNSKDSRYTISKLLMNSLYGRFGMSPVMEIHEVISSFDSQFWLSDKDIINVIDLCNGKELVSFLEQTNNSSKKVNISIGIAMAITAYARIHMSQYLNLPNCKVYYTDTDSVFLDKPKIWLVKN